MTNHGVAAVTLFWLSRPSVCLDSVTLSLVEIRKNTKCQKPSFEHQASGRYVTLAIEPRFHDREFS
jgi:hypothetical protein